MMARPSYSNYGEDVRFHTGRPLKAEDVEYSWNRCRNEIGDKGRCKGQLSDVASFAATGSMSSPSFSIR